MKSLPRFLLAGSILGAFFTGTTLYIFLPSVTGLIFAQPITLVSVPFVDYTASPDAVSWPLWWLVPIGILAGFLWRRHTRK